jgi:hypothetical protein
MLLRRISADSGQRTTRPSEYNRKKDDLMNGSWPILSGHFIKVDKIQNAHCRTKYRLLFAFIGYRQKRWGRPGSGIFMYVYALNLRGTR